MADLPCQLEFPAVLITTGEYLLDNVAGPP